VAHRWSGHDRRDDPHLTLCQRSNPLIDHDFVDVLAWDLADATLRWLQAPDDERRQRVLSRASFAPACELYMGAA